MKTKRLPTISKHQSCPHHLPCSFFPNFQVSRIDYFMLIVVFPPLTNIQLEEILENMGCEASQAFQPPPTPHRTTSFRTFQPTKRKTLYRGFCFGSRTIQIYCSDSHSGSVLVQPIFQQSNESQTHIPHSLTVIPMHSD